MLNESCAVFGTSLVLVPYLPHHVDRYHRWMSDPDILHDTCSEQQTMEEEIENQRDWLKASDKLTFIILAPSEVAGLPRYTPVGDCNLFQILNADENEMEVNVMVAEGAFRGKGVAREAVSLLMSYAMDQMDQKVFVAKILNTNAPSKCLFEKSKSLAFTAWKEVSAFNETHYLRRFEDSASCSNFMKGCGYRLQPYTRELETALCGKSQV